MAMLPEITNFQEALTILGHMNMLQAELQTLRNPMTDLELIICHCQKMSTNPKFAEQFVPIKLKYLQTTLTQTADLPPLPLLPLLSRANTRNLAHGLPTVLMSPFTHAPTIAWLERAQYWPPLLPHAIARLETGIEIQP